MGFGHSRGPILGCRSLDLHGSATTTADQMMMMSATTPAVPGFPILADQLVDLLILVEHGQGSVDRCEADEFASLLEGSVQVLGTTEFAACCQCLSNRTALSCAAQLIHDESAGEAVFRLLSGNRPTAKITKMASATRTIVGPEGRSR